MAVRRVPLLTSDLLRRIAEFLPTQSSLLAFASACRTFQTAARPVLYAPPYLNSTKAARMFAEPFAGAVGPWGRARGPEGMLEWKRWTPKELHFSQVDRQPREHGKKAEHWPLPPFVYSGPPCVTCDSPLAAGNADERWTEVELVDGGSRSMKHRVPAETFLSKTSLATLEAFPHLTRLNFHRCALPDEVLARLLGASSSLRSRLRELHFDECCVFQGAIEWGLVVQVTGCSVKWAKKSSQQFFDEDQFGADEDWITDDEGERLGDALRKWDFEDRESERDWEHSIQYEEWLEEQAEARRAYEKAAPHHTIVPGPASSPEDFILDLTWSTPSPPATPPLSVSDDDFASSISSTSSHRRIRPSAKRRAVLERATTTTHAFVSLDGPTSSTALLRPTPRFTSLLSCAASPSLTSLA